MKMPLKYLAIIKGRLNCLLHFNKSKLSLNLIFLPKDKYLDPLLQEEYNAHNKRFIFSSDEIQAY